MGCLYRHRRGRPSPIHPWKPEILYDSAFRLYLDLAARRRVEPGPLVTHTMPMQDFRQGFRTACEKATYASIKVLRRGDGLT
jgi:hypothetical protein